MKFYYRDWQIIDAIRNGVGQHGPAMTLHVSKIWLGLKLKFGNFS